MSLKRKLLLFLQGSMILTIANISTKAINFFLLPLYTKYLTPEQLGVSDTITTFTSLVSPFLILGLDSAFSAFYFDEESLGYKKKVFTSISFILMITSIVPIILMIFAEPISSLLFQKTEYSYIVVLSLASLSLQLWYLPFSIYLRVENRMKAYGIITTAASLIMIVSNIITVSVFKMGASALIISTCVTNAAMLVMYGIVSKLLPKKEFFDIPLSKRLLKYSIPLVPTVVSTWILTASSRIMLVRFVGEEAVGLYGIVTRFITVINVFTNSVSTAYTTFAYSSKDDDSGPVIYSKILNILYLLLASVVFFISIFSKEILNLMVDPQYQEAYKYMPLLLFAQVIYAAVTIVGYGIAFVKKSQLTLIYVGAAAIVNVVINMIMIPKYGIMAAAFAAWISNMLMLIIAYVLAQKLYPCPYEIWKLILSSIMLLVVSMISIFIFGLILKILLFVIFMGLMMLLYRKNIMEIIYQVRLYMIGRKDG